MNGRMAKKIRKVVHQEIRTDLEKLVQTLQKDKLRVRIKYAFKIIFKKKMKLFFHAEK